jgi:glycosyltransferase involved in cell wall biosynthesis
MKISFLIPSYNHSKYIEFTLESIYNDAFELDYEIILIDDGSTDDSKTIIENWCKARSNVNIKLKFRENLGVSATANELIRMSSGNVIRFCASDDAIFKGSSIFIMNYFSKSTYMVLVGDAYIINKKNIIVGNSAIENNGGSLTNLKSIDGLHKEIVGNWSIPGPCFAMQREIFDKVGYFSEDLLIEDWDFFLRVTAFRSIVFTESYFSLYRIHTENTSRTRNIPRKIINLNNQYTAGKRNLHLFAGYLKIILLLECFKLNLKIIIFKFINFFKK